MSRAVTPAQPLLPDRREDPDRRGDPGHREHQRHREGPGHREDPGHRATPIHQDGSRSPLQTDSCDAPEHCGEPHVYPTVTRCLRLRRR